MGQSESCLGGDSQSLSQSQSESRRNKRRLGAEGDPQIGFVPARHALTDQSIVPSGTFGPGSGGSRQVAGPYTSTPLPHIAPRKPFRFRRTYGGQSNSQSQQSSSTSRSSALDSGHGYFNVKLPPIGVSLEPARPPDAIGSGFSQNQDEEMVEAASMLALSQSSQSHKRIKLEMELDTADGSLTGRLSVGARNSAGAFQSVGPNAVLMNIPSHVCSICQEHVKCAANANSQEDSQQSDNQNYLQPGSQVPTLEELNRMFDRNEAQQLYALERQLMTEVGYINHSEIVGFTKERRSVEEEIINRLKRPDLFDGLRKFTATGVLISGHQGNGKTTMARIIADYITYRYINVLPHYFDSVDKYQRLVGIFRLARRTQPAVIVFDAADQLNRKKNPMFGSSKKLQQLFITEFRNSVQSGDQIVVILTMNSCPHNLPHGMLDCFEHKIHLELPNDEERPALLNFFMRSTINSLSQAEYHFIADLIRGYPRGQILTLCRMASNIPAMEVPANIFPGRNPLSANVAFRAVTCNDFILSIKKLSKMDSSDSQDSTMSLSYDDEETGHMSDVD